MMNNLLEIIPLLHVQANHSGKWRPMLCRSMVLVLFLFLAAQDGAAQDIRIGGSEPERSTQRNIPATKPVPPRREAFADISIVSDEDCILFIDGARQRDTLRAGKSTVKRLPVGTHRLSAESTVSGYLFSQRFKVDDGRRKLYQIRVKEAFDAHMKRVETALLQQQ